MLYVEICSSVMPIPQLRLTFQSTIDDATHLKYSHKDFIHQFVKHRPRTGFSHTIEHDVVTEYLNNVSVHFFVS
jgi:inhibitor of KinA sporulation pathway (predicted exonuclease)